MVKKMVRNHDLSTGKIVEREMTDEELAQFEADLVEQVKRETEQAAQAAARQVVLDKLGLTADEVAALLG